MAQTFNIVAQLQVRGGQSARAVARNIQRSLSGINAKVNLSINSQSVAQLQRANAALQKITASLAGLTVQANKAGAAMASVAGPLNAAAANLNAVNTSAAKTNSTIAKTSQQVTQASTAVQKFGADSALAVRRFLAFSIPAGIVVGLITSIKRGVGAMIEFERELIKVSQVTGRSIDSLGKLTSEITRLSTTLGVSSAELVNVSRILSQTGLSADDTRIALAALAKSELAPTFKDIANTAEGAIAIMRQFNVTAGQLEGKLGSINAVAGNFAVEAQDLISAVRRSGGAFKAAGGSLEELIALFTSVRSTTRESADTIATGFRTIFTRIQRPRTVAFLKEIGVNLQTLEGQFVGPFEAVRRLNSALSQLESTDPRFAQVVEELGGFRQVSKVIPLIQQFGQAQKALLVAQRGGGSLARDAAKAQQTLAVQIGKVREEFVGLFRELGSSSVLRAFAETSLKLASSLIKVAGAIKPLLPLLAGFAAFQTVRLGSQFVAGFGRGLGGAGAGAIGANVGGTVSGQTTAQQNTQRTQALGANTTALNRLTIGVNQLGTTMVRSAAAQSLGRSAFRGGRPVLGPGFNTGGVVPGTGNRDTVPAMLTPGEFVIKKSSVQKHGASNLAKMNRGGEVQKLAPGGKVDIKKLNKVGGISLSPIDNKLSGSGQLTLESIITSLTTNSNLPGGITGNAALFAKGNAKKGIPAGRRKKAVDTVTAISGVGEDGRTITAEGRGFPSDKLEAKLTNNISGAIGNLVKGSAKELGGSLGIQVTKGSGNKIKDIVRSIGVSDIVGKIFEGSLARLGAPFDSKKATSQDDFDFPGGLGGNLGGFFKNLVGIPVDAKKTLDAKILSKDIAVKKTGNLIASTVNTHPTFEALLKQTLPSESARRDNVAKKKAEKARKSVKPRRAALGGPIHMALGGSLPRGTGDIRRARRLRLGADGELTPQARELARRRSERFEKRGLRHYAVSSDNMGSFASLTNLAARVPKSVRKVNFVVGPSGSGKSTITRALGAKALINPADAKKAHALTFELGGQKMGQHVLDIIAATTRTGGQGIALDKGVMTIINQRERRREETEAGNQPPEDQRTPAQIKGTRHAPKSGKTLISNIKTMFPALQIRKFAEGGESAPQGVASSDTVPALLTPGEFVFNKNAVNRIGAGNLHRLNKGEQPQGFAAGGIVQRFAAGGQAGEASNKITQVAFGGSFLLGFAQTLTKADSTMQKFTQALTGALVAFTLFNGILGKAALAGASFSANKIAGSGGKTGANQSIGQVFGAGYKRGSNPYKGISNVTQFYPNGSAIPRQQRGRAARFVGGVAGGTRRAVAASRNSERGGAITGAGVAVISSALVVMGQRAQEAAAKMASLATTVPQLDAAIAESVRGSGLQGAGIGVGAGAGIGFLLGGPLGAALGAAAGGLIGKFVGENNAEVESLKKAFRQAKLDKELTALGSTLSRLNSGKLGFNASTISSVNRSLNDVQTRVQGTVGAERAGALQQAQGKLPEIQGLVSTLASKIEAEDSEEALQKFSDSFGGFGRSLIEKLSLLKGLPIKEIESQIKTEIKIRAGAVKNQLGLNRALATLNKELDSIRGFGAVLQSSTAIMQKFNSSMSLTSQLLAGDVIPLLRVPEAGAGNVFGRAAKGNASATEITDAINKIVPSDQAGSVATTAIDTAKAIKELPGILVDSVNASSLSNPEQSVKVLRGKLEGKGIEAGVVDRIVRRFQAQLNSRSGGGGESKFFKEVLSDVEGFADKLITSADKAIFKELEALGKEVSNSFKAFASASQQIGKLDLAIAQQRLKVEKSRFTSEIALAKLRGKDVSLGQIEGSFNAQQTQLAGGLAGNSGGIARELTSLRRRLVKIQEERSSTAAIGGVGSVEKLAKLNSEFTTLSVQSVKLNQALGLLSESSGKLALLQGKLSQERAKRETKFNTALDVATGGRDVQRSFAKSVTNALRISARGGNVKGIKQSEVKDVVSLAKQFKDIKSAAFGQTKKGENRTGQEFLELIVKKFAKQQFAGAPQLQKAFIKNTIEGSTEEGKLKVAIVSTIEHQETAIVDKLQVLIDAEKDAKKALEQSQTKTANKIEAGVILRKEADVKSKELGKAKERQATATTEVQAVANIINATGNRRVSAVDDSRRLVAQRDEIQALAQQRVKSKEEVEGFKVIDFFTKSGNNSRDGTDLGGIEQALKDFGDFGVDEAGTLNVNEVRRQFQAFLGGGKDSVSLERGKLAYLNNKDSFEPIITKLFNGLQQIAADRDEGLLGITALANPFNNESFKSVSKSVAGDILKELKRVQEEKIRITGETNKKAKEFNIDDIDKFIKILDNPEQFDKLQKSVEALKGFTKVQLIEIPKTFIRVNEEVAKIELAFKGITERIEALNSGAATPRAAGGFIPSNFGTDAGKHRRGTDTRLAVLTPGEFVVNKKSAQQNAGLLQAINKGSSSAFSSGGTVQRLADGGGVEPEPEYKRRLKLAYYEQLQEAHEKESRKTPRQFNEIRRKMKYIGSSNPTFASSEFTDQQLGAYTSEGYLTMIRGSHNPSRGIDPPDGLAKSLTKAKAGIDTGKGVGSTDSVDAIIALAKSRGETISRDEAKVRAKAKLDKTFGGEAKARIAAAKARTAKSKARTAAAKARTAKSKARLKELREEEEFRANEAGLAEAFAPAKPLVARVKDIDPDEVVAKELPTKAKDFDPNAKVSKPLVAKPDVALAKDSSPLVIKRGPARPGGPKATAKEEVAPQFRPRPTREQADAAFEQGSVFRKRPSHEQRDVSQGTGRTNADRKNKIRGGTLINNRADRPEFIHRAILAEREAASTGAYNARGRAADEKARAFDKLREGRNAITESSDLEGLIIELEKELANAQRLHDDKAVGGTRENELKAMRERVDEAKAAKKLYSTKIKKIGKEQRGATRRGDALAIIKKFPITLRNVGETLASNPNIDIAAYMGALENIQRLEKLSVSPSGEKEEDNPILAQRGMKFNKNGDVISKDGNHIYKRPILGEGSRAIGGAPVTRSELQLAKRSFAPDDGGPAILEQLKLWRGALPEIKLAEADIQKEIAAKKALPKVPNGAPNEKLDIANEKILRARRKKAALIAKQSTFFPASKGVQLKNGDVGEKALGKITVPKYDAQGRPIFRDAEGEIPYDSEGKATRPGGTAVTVTKFRATHSSDYEARSARGEQKGVRIVNLRSQRSLDKERSINSFRKRGDDRLDKIRKGLSPEDFVRFKKLQDIKDAKDPSLHSTRRYQALNNLNSQPDLTPKQQEEYFDLFDKSYKARKAAKKALAPEGRDALPDPDLTPEERDAKKRDKAALKKKLKEKRAGRGNTKAQAELDAEENKGLSDFRLLDKYANGSNVRLRGMARGLLAITAPGRGGADPEIEKIDPDDPFADKTFIPQIKGQHQIPSDLQDFGEGLVRERSVANFLDDLRTAKFLQDEGLQQRRFDTLEGRRKARNKKLNDTGRARREKEATRDKARRDRGLRPVRRGGVQRDRAALDDEGNPLLDDAGNPVFENRDDDIERRGAAREARGQDRRADRRGRLGRGRGGKNSSSVTKNASSRAADRRERLRNRGRRRFAEGGAVPGVGNGDRVKALLEPGEFVLSRKSVEGMGGLDHLTNLNQNFTRSGRKNTSGRFEFGGGVGSGGGMALAPTAIQELRGFNTEFAGSVTRLEDAMHGLSGLKFGALTTALSGFNSAANSLASTLSAFSGLEVTHKIADINLNVNLNGATFLSGIGDLISGGIKTAIAAAVRQQKEETRDGKNPGQ